MAPCGAPPPRTLTDNLTAHITEHRMLEWRPLPALVLLMVVLLMPLGPRCSAASPIMGQAHAQRQAGRPVLASVGLENRSRIRLQAQDQRQQEAWADGETAPSSRAEGAPASSKPVVSGPAPSTPTHMRSSGGTVSTMDTIPRMLESISTAAPTHLSSSVRAEGVPTLIPTEAPLMPTTAPSRSPSVVPSIQPPTR